MAHDPKPLTLLEEMRAKRNPPAPPPDYSSKIKRLESEFSALKLQISRQVGTELQKAKPGLESPTILNFAYDSTGMESRISSLEKEITELSTLKEDKEN